MNRVLHSRAGRLGAFSTGLLLLLPPPPATAHDLEVALLVSARADGELADRPSGTFGLSVSGDASTVAFSAAAALVEQDTNDTVDVYVRHLSTQVVELAAVTAAGVPADGLSLRPSLDGTGSKVAFVSAASNLDPADTDGFADVYVKDLRTRELVLASIGGDGRRGTGSSTGASLSADGTSVAFISRAALVDEDLDTAPDVYVKDLVDGGLQLASATADGHEPEPGPYGVGVVSVSGDGSRVAFDTDARLDALDGDSATDVYVKDLGTGELVRASVSGDGSETAAGAYRPSLSADGLTVAFDSFAADLSPDDLEADGDVHVKELATDRLVVASRGDGEARDASLSADGTKVAFSSTSTDLDAGDTGPGLDTYVTELATGAVFLASSTPTGAAAGAPSIGPALSGDASVVAFATPAADLGPPDTNGVADVYVRAVPWSAQDAPRLHLQAEVVDGRLGGRTLLVEVSGAAGSAAGVATVTLEVVDEYGRAEPIVAPVHGAGAVEVAFARSLLLQARVRHDDPDGRVYTLHAVMTDVEGRQALDHVHVTATP